ncbi:MAG TPA: hypothetical protein VMH39_03655, partial [Gemmatimonadaceae bacterium]|nr:hypothetical protein [Gemmatimonadaceae bacterium]
LDYGDDILTKAQYTGISGNPQIVEHASTATLTGLPNSRTEDVFCRDDPEAYARAELAVALRSAESFGPVAITYNAGETSAAFDSFLLLELNNRVRLKTTAPGESTRSSDHFIASIDTDWDDQDPNALKVTLGLIPAAPWDALGSSWLVLDSGTVGKLNTGRLAY